MTVPTITSPLLRAAFLAVLSAFLFLASLTAAEAGISPWAENEGGRMRLIALPPEEDGTIRAALQIEPAPGWMTYWREPGDAGIPPQITLAPGSNIRLEKIAYPVPKRIDNGDLRDIGYDAAVTLPLLFSTEDTSGPLKLEASAFIGICRNICVPFQADFSLKLDRQAGTPVEENMLLVLAEATLPQPPAADFALTRHTLSGDGKTLSLELLLPENAPDAIEIFVTGPEGHVVFDQIDPRRDGRNLSLAMPVGKLPKGYDIKGKTWRILAVAGKRSMETSLAFE